MMYLTEKLALGLLILIILFIIVGIPFIAYYSACREASIYNKRNETNYSCSDFFWAKDQINQGTRSLELEIIK